MLENCGSFNVRRALLEHVAMTHQSERGSGRMLDPASLDREADRLLAEGQHRIAERLSHLAAGLRALAEAVPV